MRIPLYISGRDPNNITPNDAYPMFEFADLIEVCKVCNLLDKFVSNPPSPLQPCDPHHFVDEI